MRKLPMLTAVAAIGLVLSQSAFAQPRPYEQPGRPHDQPQSWRPQGPGPGARPGGQYYYNGRWLGADEWQRRGPERDRWARNYQRRRGHRDNNDSSALIAGIIGFALGAAIVGSQQQAERARTADESFDTYCARKYRSYDRRSRTYMGADGLRHYCQ